MTFINYQQTVNNAFKSCWYFPFWFRRSKG